MRKQNKKKIKKGNSGITLIALVVTIIVLLILAGISIGMLTGNNGILKQARNTKTESERGEIIEKIELANLSAVARAKGEDNLVLLKQELAKELGEEGTDWEIVDEEANPWVVKVGDVEYEIAHGTTDGGGETKTVADLRADAISKGVTALSTEDTTTIKDNKDNEIKVPKGFGIATDSGINVEEGIVIEDATHEGTTKGSQFVWVPVGDVNVSTTIDGSGTINIPLARGTFDTSTGAFTTVQTQTGTQYSATTSSSVINPLFFEFKDNAESQSVKNATYGNTKAKSISGFVESVLSNGGYYIARYEAGINASTDQYAYANCSGSGTSLAYGDSTKMFAKNGDVKPLSIKGRGIWNAVTQGEAATIAGSMYNTSTDKVTSDLVNSYAWDTAILFIQKCGNNGDDSSKYSIQGGYSAISTSERATAGNNKLQYQPGGTTARTTAIYDTQCKICDMAGNVYEWTTETFSVTGFPFVYRGGHYGVTDSYAARRYDGVSDQAGYSFGFRPLLYL